MKKAGSQVGAPAFVFNLKITTTMKRYIFSGFGSSGWVVVRMYWPMAW